MVAMIVPALPDVVILLEHFSITICGFYMALNLENMFSNINHARSIGAIHIHLKNRIHSKSSTRVLLLYCNRLVLCHNIMRIETDVLDILENITLSHLTDEVMLINLGSR